MNMTLTALNAAALVALVAFHFQDSKPTDQVIAQSVPSHQMVRHAPQLAVMKDKSINAAMLTNDADDNLRIAHSEQRWVF
jgi:hypothetical protein